MIRPLSRKLRLLTGSNHDRRYGALALLMLSLASTLFPPIRAQAQGPTMVADNTGGNGAVEGKVVDIDPQRPDPGHVLIVLKNRHKFWTNILLDPPIGVTLKPGPGAEGVYASLGIIGPDGSAVWDATFDGARPAQVFVRTTPYLTATTTGGLAAALNIINIVTEMLPGISSNKILRSMGVLGYADKVVSAAHLVGGLFGDKLAQDFTKEGLLSGSLARDIFDVLSDREKARVLLSALDLVGVKVSLGALKGLVAWLPAVRLFEITWDLASSLVLSTSSGGVVFRTPGLATPSIDWRNTRYTTDCAGASQGPFDVEVHDGKGVGLPGAAQKYDVTVVDARTGDMAGDGSRVAAVLLDCHPDPSNYSTTEIQVFTVDQKRLGTLRPPDIQNEHNLDPLFDGKPFEFRGTHLITGAVYYGPNDCHAGGPSIHHDVDWTWDKASFLGKVGPASPGPGQPCQDPTQGTTPSAAPGLSESSTLVFDGIGPVRVGHDGG